MRNIAAAVAIAAALPALAGASSVGTPGVTSNSILLGGTVPLSGQASPFGVVGPGAAAYFKYVNARGGVHRRKIKYVYRDDGYDTSLTIEETKRLVQQDKVFAIFNSVGTEHALAVRTYLNQLKVPHLFVGSGASKLGRGAKRYPWSMGYLPSFFGEGAVYGRYVAKTRPTTKIGVLYESSDYGKDLLKGLEKGLGRKKGLIVARQSYNTTDSNVRSQVTKLRRSGAKTFMIFALPTYAIQSFVYAYQLGWRPKIFLSSVSVEPTIMEIARGSTNGKTTEGAVSIAFLKDPTTDRWANDRAIRLYRRILKRFSPGSKASNVYNYYGMTVAFSMVDALKHAGRKLTRKGLLHAAAHMDERNNPFLLPGVHVQTSPQDYFPIAKVKMIRYHRAEWVYFGPLVGARG
ncbi:MAG: ABC transporter substrate-binding protein [Actinomycetota bacterium]|nr:ABC transporter substrate-binding protein [Actinomycetota bacterium]